MSVGANKPGKSGHPDEDKDVELDWTHHTEVQNQCNRKGSNREPTSEEETRENQKQLEEVKRHRGKRTKVHLHGAEEDILGPGAMKVSW